MKALIFNIQGYSIHDGPGIRTTVFFKGCPLNCIWCANPESINNFPEVLFTESKCVKCYHCKEICPHSAITIPEERGYIHINREICINCKEYVCAKECYQRAIEIAGYDITCDNLLKEVEKDSLFYTNSGGGITLSGGEPLYQYEFTLQFLQNIKGKGFHITLDTSGFISWEKFRPILEFTDLILYDLKHIDPTVHKKLTGVSNEQILMNLEKILTLTNVPVIIRYPVIPGYNDSKENVDAMINFVKALEIKEVNLLPYHRLGKSKYERLGKKSSFIDEIQSPSTSQLEEMKKYVESFHIRCLIG